MKKTGRHRQILFLFLIIFTLTASLAQESGDLRLVDWVPKSQMVVKETVILKPFNSSPGRFMIYGLFLPDEVLEKIYNRNALKIFGMFKGM